MCKVSNKDNSFGKRRKDEDHVRSLDSSDEDDKTSKRATNASKAGSPFASPSTLATPVAKRKGGNRGFSKLATKAGNIQVSTWKQLGVERDNKCMMRVSKCTAN